MEQVIFLTETQKDLLDECKLSVRLLVNGEADNYLSSTDLLDIRNRTEHLRMEGGPLDLVGLGRTKIESDIDMVRDVKYDEWILEMGKSKWEAECPLPNTIVLWPVAEANCPSIPNSMMKCNLRTVVHAMSKVMSFKDLTCTEAFERSVLMS